MQVFDEEVFSSLRHHLELDLESTEISRHHEVFDQLVPLSFIWGLHFKNIIKLADLKQTCVYHGEVSCYQPYNLFLLQQPTGHSR